MTTAALERRVSPPLLPPLNRRLRPSDSLVRAVLAFAVARARSQNESPTALVEAAWPEDDNSRLIARAMTSPATLSDPSWAGLLAGVAVGDFLSSLPSSVFSVLRRNGMLVQSAGKEPTRVPTVANPMTASRFVGAGRPIPVLSGQLSGPTLGPKKIAGIVVASVELLLGPSAETVMRRLLEESATTGLDDALFADTAATDEAPAGLLHNAVEVDASDNPDPLTAMRIDLAAMAGALDPSASDNLTIAGNKKEIAFLRASVPAAFTVLATPALPEGEVVMIDAGGFVSGGDGLPLIDRSEMAAINTADPALPVVDNAGVKATPVLGLWQQALVGFRVLLPADFSMRRSGLVAHLAGASW